MLFVHFLLDFGEELTELHAAIPTLSWSGLPWLFLCLSLCLCLCLRRLLSLRLCLRLLRLWLLLLLLLRLWLLLLLLLLRLLRLLRLLGSHSLLCILLPLLHTSH